MMLGYLRDFLSMLMLTYGLLDPYFILPLEIYLLDVATLFFTTVYVGDLINDCITYALIFVTAFLKENKPYYRLTSNPGKFTFTFM